MMIHLQESFDFHFLPLSQENHMSGKNGHGLSKHIFSIFDAQVAAFLEAHEADPLEISDEDLNISVVDDQDVTSIDRAATASRVTSSRNLHYLLANLTTDASRLMIRQNYESNDFEIWRRLEKKFALRDKIKYMSLLIQNLDFKFNSQTFE